MGAVTLSISGSASTTERVGPARRARRSLAGPGGRSYLALVAWVACAAGCRHAPPPLAPDAAEFAAISAEEFAAAAAPTLPRGSELVALRWRFRDATGSVSGRGAVRVSPPDSLRIDVRGPLGFGHGTLVIAGGEAWADPEDLVQQVLPRRYLVWAMLGVVRAPEAALRYEAGEAGGRRLVRCGEPDGVATTFVLRGDTLAGAVQVRGDRVVGRLTLVRDARGALVHADAEDLERHARLSFDIQSRTPSGAFPAEVWRHP
jgi:hypothetical protein